MKNFKMNMLCLFVLGVTVFWNSSLAEASSLKDIIGPTRVQPGIAYTYFVEVNGSFADVGWNIAGGNVLQQWWEGSQFFCQVQWVETAPDKPATLEAWGKEKNGRVKMEHLSVTIQPATTPTVPAQARKFSHLNGPTRIRVGSTYTYSVTVIGSFADVGWNVTGGNVLQQWWEDPQFFCQVQWDGSNPDKPAMLEVWGQDKYGRINVEHLSVTSQPTPTPSVPETPGKLKKLNGLTSVQFGQISTYSVTAEGAFAEVAWEANGGKILRQWKKGSQYFCEVQWDENAPGKIKVFGKQQDGKIIAVQRLSVSPEPGEPGSFNNLIGSAAIEFGQTYTYSITVAGSFTEIGWSASGGAVLKQWWQGNQFFCQVQWDQNQFTDLSKIKVWGKQLTGEFADERLHVVVQMTPPMDQPRGMGFGVLHSGGNTCLDVPPADLKKNGGKVQTWACTWQPQQLWLFDQHDRVINQEGQCLAVAPEDVMKDAGRVYLWECNAEPYEQWKLDQQGGLVNQAGGYCLEIHADDLSINGGRVRILRCHYDANQQWRFQLLQK